MVYAEFGGQTECIMGNSKIENLGDIMNGRRARGTRVPASPLARSRVLALLAQIGQLARRLNVFQVLVLASF